jgi:hypothetical protein
MNKLIFLSFEATFIKDPNYPSVSYRRKPGRNKAMLVEIAVSSSMHKIHSVIFYRIALSKQTCHMLMDEPSTYDMLAILKKNRYVDGSTVNI